MAAKNLRNAVFAQLRGTKAEKMQTLRDVARNGGDKGTSGFIYYTETRAFARRNRALIVARLTDATESMGTKTLAELIVTFGTMKHEKPLDVERALGKYLNGRKDDNDDALCHLENTLAWFALEEVAHDVDNEEWDRRDAAKRTPATPATPAA